MKFLKRISLDRFGNHQDDPMTGASKGITLEHDKIHDGKHFYVCGFTVSATGTTTIFGVTTPNSNTQSHMTFEVEGTSRTEFRVYETAQFTTGSAVTIQNNNRNSTRTSSLAIVSSPIVNTAGTVIFAQSKGLEGTNPVAASSEGVTRRENEIILKTNTAYTFEITSRDDDNVISYCGEWYEIVPKNL
jgi:hypothetical protein